MSGANLDFIKGGWNASAAINTVQFPNALPIYFRGNEIIDSTVVYTGPVLSQSLTAHGTDAGSTDTYSVTLNTGLRVDTEGIIIIFKANTANTGNCALTINSGSTTRNIVKGVSTTLSTNDILAGMYCMVTYDPTNHFYVLMNPRTL